MFAIPQVLIFVQTVQMLRILEKFLDARGLRHVQLHGYPLHKTR